jgi:hypothetical protein
MQFKDGEISLAQLILRKLSKKLQGRLELYMELMEQKMQYMEVIQ